MRRNGRGSASIAVKGIVPTLSYVPHTYCIATRELWRTGMTELRWYVGGTSITQHTKFLTSTGTCKTRKTHDTWGHVWHRKRLNVCLLVVRCEGHITTVWKGLDDEHSAFDE
jgi:hypothetical protein